ncbi:TIGR01906 family membrane protein [Enterococcus bulliens]
MNRVVRFFQWVSLYLTLVSTAILITINSTWLYRITIDREHLTTVTTLSKAELLQEYHQLLAYLNFPWVRTLSLASFPMSESGLQHFVDVKQLFFVNHLVFIITLVPTIWFVYQLVRTRSEWQFIRPMQVAMVIPFVIACLMVAGFDRFFITFHELLFRNADWVFDPRTDPIINVLPETFFFACFVLFFVCLEGFFLLFYLFGRWSVQRKR